MRNDKLLSPSFSRMVRAEDGLEARTGKVEMRTILFVRPKALLQFLILVVASVGMLGCSTGTTKVVTPTISLLVTQPPPASLLVGGTATVSATVSNDIANAGADWVAVCVSTHPCGSFSPAHTDSGAATTFTAPADVPTKGNTVAITALSATDHSKSFTAPVSITSTVTGVTIDLAPSSLAAGAQAIISATVAGDPTNAGVNWSATCADINNVCGSVGGNPLSFTAPPVVPAGNTVTLTAVSVVDHNFSATTIVTITAAISIAITRAPPSSLLENATANLIAKVSNDPTNAGVDWIVQCQGTPCGSVSPAHTASGVATTFTAPSSVPPAGPGGNPPAGTVDIIASSTASSGTTATITLTITAPISVVINGAPNSLFTGDATPTPPGLTATVTNDPTNAGVDWTVTCSSADCGSFSSTHAPIDPSTISTTPTTTPTTYTAPATVPTGGSVTITATSTKDPTKSDHKIITILPITPNTLLNGQFVFLVTGMDANLSFYSLAGTIAGNGEHITGGEVDIIDSAVQTTAPNTPVCGFPVPLIGPCVGATPSTYNIGPDGRGQINIILPSSAASGFGVSVNSGLNTQVTLSVAFVTPKHALLSETDTFGSGTGTLDLQNATDLAAFFQNGVPNFNGTYSVALSGTEFGTTNRFSLASALKMQLDTTTTTPTVTETAVGDQSDKGVVMSNAVPTAPASISTTGADQFGRFLGSGAIDLGVNNLGMNKLQLIAYFIDKNHFVITDFGDSFNPQTAPALLIGGYMVAQPPASPSPVISGTYAFTEAGSTVSPSLQPQVAGGIFTCGSAGGVLDATPLAPLGGTPTVNQAISGTCTDPANGRGSITLSGPGSTATKISQFAAYPTLDMGLQLIELDGGSTGTFGPSGAGVALQQAAVPITASTLNNKYASNFLATLATGATANSLEGFAGQIVSANSSATLTLSGTVDVNSFDATAVPPVLPSIPSLNASLSPGSSYTAFPNGRFPLTLTLNPDLTPVPPLPPQPTPKISTLHLACYIVDANTCLTLGLDTTGPGTGILQLQNLGF